MKFGIVGIFVCLLLATALGRGLRSVTSSRTTVESSGGDFVISAGGSSTARTPGQEETASTQVEVTGEGSETVSEKSGSPSDAPKASIEEDPKKLDVYFLIDLTEKKTAYVEDLKDAAEDIVNTLVEVAEDVDIRFGVGTYGDIPSTPKFINDQPVAEKSEKAIYALTNLTAVELNPPKESQLFALEQVATNKTLKFRNKAKKVVVWMGNVQGKDPVKGATEDSAIEALKEKRIHVIAIDTDKLNKNGQAARIAKETSGIFYAVNEDGEFMTVSQTQTSQETGSSASASGTGDVVITTTRVEVDSTQVETPVSLEDAIIDSVISIGLE